MPWTEYERSLHNVTSDINAQKALQRGHHSCDARKENFIDRDENLVTGSEMTIIQASLEAILIMASDGLDT